MNKTLEESFNWLWEAYGYPKGKSEEVRHRLTQIGDERSQEYYEKTVLLKQLSRLEELKRAIADERRQNMKRDEDNDKLYQQNVELRRKIDRLRADAAEAEPSTKLRKASSQQEEQELRRLRQENADLRQALRPKMSKDALEEHRQKLLREIEQLELYQEVVKQQPIVLDAIERMYRTQQPPPDVDQVKKFLVGPIYRKKTENRQELAAKLDEILQKTAEHWKDRRVRNQQKAKAEDIERWQSYERSALFYQTVVMPKIALLELKPSEKGMQAKAEGAPFLIARKREQLDQVEKDLSFYEKFQPLGCLVCGETRQELLWQERNNPTRVFCGKKCQAKSSVAPRAAPLSFLRHN